jgi:hypothetical protein
MKTHSWPHPVLVTASISEQEYERDYQLGVDLTFSLAKTGKGRFTARIMVGSPSLRRHIDIKDVELVLYLEALESPLRLARRLPGSAFGRESEIEIPVDIDQSKFSGGLKVCVYLVARIGFKLSTADCVEGYEPEVPVEQGALVGYSNALLLYDDKSNISNIFKVRKNDSIELMTVNCADDFIDVNLPTDMYEKYTLFRLKNTNVTACSFLFPALVETISSMAEGCSELEQWPDGFHGAKFVVAQTLAKEGISPRDVAQRGAVRAASALFSRFKENHVKLFGELRATYQSE